MNSPEAFYRAAYEGSRYATGATEGEHCAAGEVRGFLDIYRLRESRCLEVGSGRGAFQDLVEDYTGLDLSDTVASGYHKPFFTGSAEDLPFDDSTFDAAWSITVLEHISDPERALTEMRRVLRNGAMLFLKPAWNCRTWNCEGIPVRRYSELSIRQKWIKATLPIRDSLAVRGFQALPRRIFRVLQGFGGEAPLRFKKLEANYETFWMADSDACSSIDPFDVIQWFRSRGDRVLSHPNWRSALLSRSEALVVQVVKE